jgi:geranylgeranyl pyrophosphate synthase
MAPTMDYRNIQEPVLPLLRATEQILARKIGSRVGLISELGRCTPVGKGKKIRAAFFFLLARLNGAGDDGLPTLGAAIEMLHLSSLVHDDIIDHSSRRRGEKTPNHHFGDTLSVLWGDFLFINSIRMLTREGRGAAVDMLAETSRQMIEGQILEFENNFNYRLPPRTYYDIIRRKTSSLFSGIAGLAAGLPGGSARRISDFRRCGQDFGMIFQISDDLLDLFSERSGKGRFQDLKEGKVTLPYILLIAGGGLPLIRAFDHSGPGPLLESCRSLGVRERSLEIIDRYHRRCRGFLRSFPPSPYRASLEGLLEFIRYREY